jgi:penicillin amidase
VVVGHNDRISWGVTNLGPDVQDLFIERINPENPSQYEVNGRWVDMKITKEEIRVKGKEEPVVLMARETRHGPIITDESGFPGYRGFAVNPAGQFPINLELKGLALRWTALRSNTTFRSVILLDQARTFTEFREALRSWDIPAQNFVYADKDGNIGYQSTGLIPIRKKGDGSIPAPGWTDEYEWAGFIPFDDMPYSYNPTKGYIVTANNAVTSGSYKYFIGTESDMGYRARRIVQMIETAKNNITVSDVERMQSDSLNISALEIIPYLKTLPLADVTAANARDILVQWDGRMDTGSAGAALFSYFWLALVEETFKDKIPQSLWNPDGVFDSNSRFMNTVYRILKDPQDPFWDRTATLDRRETRDDILQASLSKAVKLGTKAQGKDLRAWRWGREHTAVFRNQSFGKSGISLIERIFNRGPVPVSGGFQQVVSSDWKINAPFTVYAISSMRQIIDLGNLAGSLMMNATGQSGHPGNRHYDDMIDPWSKVRYHPTFWDRTALEKAGFQRLTLQPK